MNRILMYFAVAMAAFLSGCGREQLYQPVRPDKFRTGVFYSMVSSSVILSEREPQERTGTNIRIDTEEEIVKNDGGWIWKRTPVKKVAKGWNKALLPKVLENSTGLKILFDSSFIPLEFYGYDTIYSQLSNLKQKEGIKNRMIDAVDTVLLKNIHADRWKLSTFLPSGIYTPGQKIDVSEVAKDIKTVKVDSIKVLPFRKRNQNVCLEYSVFYSRKGNIQLDMEQFFETFKKRLDSLQIGSRDYYTASPKYGQVIKPGLWDDEMIEGRWTLSVELSSGNPCFESNFEKTVLDITDNFSHNKIKVQLNNYYEKIYKPL